MYLKHAYLDNQKSFLNGIKCIGFLAYGLVIKFFIPLKSGGKWFFKNQNGVFNICIKCEKFLFFFYLHMVGAKWYKIVNFWWEKR